MQKRVDTTKIMELINQINTPAQFSTGALATEIASRLDKGVSIRITSKGVRVTHSQYIDSLNDAPSIDKALASNQWAKC